MPETVFVSGIFLSGGGLLTNSGSKRLDANGTPGASSWTPKELQEQAAGL